MSHCSSRYIIYRAIPQHEYIQLHSYPLVLPTHFNWSEKKKPAKAWLTLTYPIRPPTTFLPRLDNKVRPQFRSRIDNKAFPTDSSTVNKATRVLHHKLNKLIISRLPLALPPYTSNSSKYVTGILHIAPIYITFESLWKTLILSPLPLTDLEENLHIGQDGMPFQISNKDKTLLSNLLLPSLLRTERLLGDIYLLAGTPQKTNDDQLKTLLETGKLEKFIAHTKQSVANAPHLLLSYLWVFYMALFAGGRVLKEILRDAGGLGTKFWNQNPSTPQHPTSSEVGTQAGLSFFEFEGDEDGEDIKIDFKKQFAEAQLSLTEEETKEIVQEAQEIFGFMIGIVEELDVIVGTDEDELEMAKRQQG